MLHPLLIKLDLLNIPDIDTACNKIENMGLLTKKHDNLIIVKYPKEFKNSAEEYIRKSRGIIIDFKSKKIINASISGGMSIDQFRDIVPNFDNVVIEKCLDGTLLNLYYNKDKWNVSTKFSINADESRFRGNKTYRELLDEIIDISNLNLDTSYTYSLLLRHKDARNVTPIKRNRLIHLESTNNITGEKVKLDIGIKTPSVIKFRNHINKKNFNSYDDVFESLKNKNWKNPGYMLYSEDRKYRVRLENPNFEYVRKMVEDQSNIEYVLLEYLYKKDIHSLLSYYPEWNTNAVEVNNIVKNYIDNIYKHYIDNKVNKTLTIIDPLYKKPLYNLHKIYLDNVKKDKNYRIVYKDVCDMVRSYDTAYLYSVLFRYK